MNISVVIKSQKPLVVVDFVIVNVSHHRKRLFLRRINIVRNARHFNNVMWNARIIALRENFNVDARIFIPRFQRTRPSLRSCFDARVDEFVRRHHRYVQKLSFSPRFLADSSRC